MITILIVTALVVYLLYKVMPIYDVADYFVIFIIGPILGGFIGLLVALTLPADNILTITKYKHRNNEFNQVIIDGELYYTFLVESDGKYVVKYISSRQLEYKVVKEPKYIIESVNKGTDNIINYFAMDRDTDYKTYVIEVDSNYIDKKIILNEI